MSDTRTFTGGCHCGAVRFSVELPPIEQLYACNCSICSKTGWLMAMAPRSAFTLLSGEENLADYQFNHEVIHHRFCTTCGIRAFADGTNPDGSENICINVRCLDGFETRDVPVQWFDGASL